MDLTDWAGYRAGKGGFRHFDRAVVGWLDGHVSAHPRSFVFQRGDREGPYELYGNDRLVYWNRK